MQHRVIWNLVLQPDSEGPTLISHAAWRSRTTPEVVPSHLRGAQSSRTANARYSVVPEYAAYRWAPRSAPVETEPSPTRPGLTPSTKLMGSPPPSPWAP